jgi:hypothetical protein
MDNLMIKIIAYVLYEAYINALNLPNTTPYVVSKLAEAGRPLSGIELAQDITDMLRNDPSHTWMEHVQSLDVPTYERTFGAFILTMDAHAQAGALRNWWNNVLLSKLPIEDVYKVFLREFKLEITKVFEERQVLRVEKADSTNKMTTGLKFLLAFIFQESYQALTPFQSVVDGLGLSDLNVYLSSINTLPKLRSTLPLTDASQSGSDESYPGERTCSSAHAKWHAQSAQGLLDLFKLVDELARKQVERKDQLSVVP